MAFAQTQAMTPFAALQCPELGACWFKDADPTVWKPIWKGQQTRRTVELKELSKEHVAAKSAVRPAKKAEKKATAMKREVSTELSKIEKQHQRVEEAKTTAVKRLRDEEYEPDQAPLPRGPSGHDDNVLPTGGLQLERVGLLRVLLKHGAKYTGEWKRQKQESPDGARIGGEWRDGLADGWGKVVPTDGHVYGQQLQDDMPEAAATTTTTMTTAAQPVIDGNSQESADDAHLDGQWPDGLANGLGKVVHADGHVHQQLRDDVPEAAATTTTTTTMTTAEQPVIKESTDDAHLEGEWQAGLAEGSGKVVHADGNVHTLIPLVICFCIIVWMAGMQVSMLQQLADMKSDGEAREQELRETVAKVEQMALEKGKAVDDVMASAREAVSRVGFVEKRLQCISEAMASQEDLMEEQQSGLRKAVRDIRQEVASLQARMGMLTLPIASRVAPVTDVSTCNPASDTLWSVRRGPTGRVHIFRIRQVARVVDCASGPCDWQRRVRRGTAVSRRYSFHLEDDSDDQTESSDETESSDSS